MGGRSERVVLLIFAALLFAGAAAIRIAQLPERILHSDEGVQAYQVWQLMEEGEYEYAPEDRHGPVLYLLSAGVLGLAGISGHELTGDHLRLVSTAAGLLLLGGFLALAVCRRDRALLLGGALIAVSPFIIIYQNFFIQESLFALLSFALLATAAIASKRMETTHAAGFGLLAALCLATKETAVIHFMAIGCACLLVYRPTAYLRKWTPKAALVALSLAIILWVGLMSLGFRRWDSVGAGIEAFAHYFHRAGGAGHEKPFSYYLSLFWPQQQAGLWWSQLTLLVGAAAGGVLAWRRRDRSSGDQAWAVLAMFSWSLWLLYSLIPYKTPWLMLTPAIGFCLLCGHAIYSLSSIRLRAVGWSLAALASLLALLEPILLWRPALFRYADDERNPYLYSHTSPGFGRLLSRMEDLLVQFPEASLAVAEPEYAWPLPWYLREHERVGHFSVLPDNPGSFDLLIVDSRLLEAGTPDSLESYAVEIHGLRTNVLLYLFVRPLIWENYLAAKQ